MTQKLEFKQLLILLGTVIVWLIWKKFPENYKKKAFLVATSKEFYNNPQNGGYAKEVVNLADVLTILKTGGD